MCSLGFELIGLASLKDNVIPGIIVPKGMGNQETLSSSKGEKQIQGVPFWLSADRLKTLY